MMIFSNFFYYFPLLFFVVVFVFFLFSFVLTVAKQRANDFREPFTMGLCPSL